MPRFADRGATRRGVRGEVLIEYNGLRLENAKVAYHGGNTDREDEKSNWTVRFAFLNGLTIQEVRDKLLVMGLVIRGLGRDGRPKVVVSHCHVDVTGVRSDSMISWGFWTRGMTDTEILKETMLQLASGEAL